MLQRDPEQELPAPEDLHAVGTTAQIVRYLTAPDGSHHVIAQGQSRFRLAEIVQTEPFLAARVERIAEEVHEELPKDIEAHFVTLEDDRMRPEVDRGYLTRHPGPRRRLLEEEAHRLALHRTSK